MSSSRAPFELILFGKPFIHTSMAMHWIHNTNTLTAYLQAWLNTVGKAQKRKGKRLFMPMRIVLTGRMQVRLTASTSTQFCMVTYMVQVVVMVMVCRWSWSWYAGGLFGLDIFNLVLFYN